MIRRKYVREKGATPRVLMREQNNIAREVATGVGVYWHENFLEKHFTQAGAAEYGYAPRDGDRLRPNAKGFRSSYQGRKLRKYGHTRPLFKTGRSRELLKIPRLRVTSVRGVATLRILLAAPAFNFSKSDWKVDMRKDITAVSRREEDQMTAYAAGDFGRRYASLN
jgi:hypothetical protein